MRFGAITKSLQMKIDEGIQDHLPPKLTEGHEPSPGKPGHTYGDVSGDIQGWLPYASAVNSPFSAVTVDPDPLPGKLDPDDPCPRRGPEAGHDRLAGFFPSRGRGSCGRNR